MTKIETDAVTCPANEQELAEAIRDTSGPLVVRGGGTRPIGRALVGAPLSVAAMTGIAMYEPGALTLVAASGTPVSEIDAALAAEGQRLPFEPMDHRGLLGTEGTPTIGGVVATNASGPRRVQAGACRDSLIGVRFVDGGGAIIKNGGRVMKNVTGYDLVKLFAGSWGTLGVLSEVSFKLLPSPESAATVVFDGLDPALAVALMAAGLGSPFDVSGAARLPDGRTALRVEGFATSVAYRAGELTRHLSRFGAANVLDTEQTKAYWQDIRDVVPFHGREGDVWRLSVKPSDAPHLIEALSVEALMDWGGGLVWLLTEPGADLRAILSGFTGHATLIRASAETRAQVAPFHPEAAAVAALSSGLRAKFDPRGILNPGLME